MRLKTVRKIMVLAVSVALAIAASGLVAPDSTLGKLVAAVIGIGAAFGVNRKRDKQIEAKK